MSEGLYVLPASFFYFANQTLIYDTVQQRPVESMVGC